MEVLFLVRNEHFIRSIVIGVLVLLLACAAAFGIALATSSRMIELSGVQGTAALWKELTDKIDDLEEKLQTPGDTPEQPNQSPLFGKKIIYDGDSIAESRDNNGGGYPALIAKLTGGTYQNFAHGGAHLTSAEGRHSVVDNLPNLPADGDLYCFEGGINDFWGNVPLGTCAPADYTGTLDTGTICGAMETIFRYCLEKAPGKPVCFVIVHKVQNTAYGKNANGDTFTDYRNAMVAVCQKYSIPYYDAFMESGLNGWNPVQSDLFLNANVDAKGDGIHPNEEGYKRYYVPQLIALFERIMPIA